MTKTNRIIKTSIKKLRDMVTLGNRRTFDGSLSFYFFYKTICTWGTVGIIGFTQYPLTQFPEVTACFNCSIVLFCIMRKDLAFLAAIISLILFFTSAYSPANLPFMLLVFLVVRLCFVVYSLRNAKIKDYIPDFDDVIQYGPGLVWACLFPISIAANGTVDFMYTCEPCEQSHSLCLDCRVAVGHSVIRHFDADDVYHTSGTFHLNTLVNKRVVDLYDDSPKTLFNQPNLIFDLDRPMVQNFCARNPSNALDQLSAITKLLTDAKTMDMSFIKNLYMHDLFSIRGTGHIGVVLNHTWNESSADFKILTVGRPHMSVSLGVVGQSDWVNVKAELGVNNLAQFKPKIDLSVNVSESTKIFIANNPKQDFDVGLRFTQASGPVKFTTEFRVVPSGRMETGIGIEFGS